MFWNKDERELNRAKIRLQQITKKTEIFRERFNLEMQIEAQKRAIDDIANKLKDPTGVYLMEQEKEKKKKKK